MWLPRALIIVSLQWFDLIYTFCLWCFFDWVREPNNLCMLYNMGTYGEDLAPVKLNYRPFKDGGSGIGCSLCGLMAVRRPGVNPQCLELPISRINFHGPKDVRGLRFDCTYRQKQSNPGSYLGEMNTLLASGKKTWAWKQNIIYFMFWDHKIDPRLCRLVACSL